MNEPLLADSDLRQLLSRLPVAAALHALDEAGSVMFVNDHFVRAFGYTLDDIPTVRDWRLRAYPDDTYRREVCAAWDVAVAKALTETGSVEATESRIVCKDGTERDVLIAATVEGRMVTVTFTDVTLHRETERGLRAATERMRMSSIAAGFGFWTRDLVTKKEEWDDQMLSIYGVSREEFTGLWEPFLHPDDRQRVEEEAQRAIDEGRYGEYVFRIIRPDGEIRHLKGMSQVIRDAEGRPTLDLGVDIDITRQVEVETVLAATRERERQSDEAHRRELEKKLKTSLNAAAIAHEINQPLSRVIFRAWQGLERATGADRDLLAALVADAERVVSIIERMKSLLRNVQTAQREIDMADVAASAMHHVKRLLLDARVTVTQRGVEHGVRVLGDAVQLQLVMINVLTNAVEAIIDGDTPRRAIEVEHRVHDGFVEVVVGDSGPGWPGGTIDQVLLKTTKAGGTGVGLYVVKTAVENHRGQVAIGRSPLGGAEFCIRLPIVDAATRVSSPHAG